MAGVAQQVALRTGGGQRRGPGGREAGGEPEVGLLSALESLSGGAKSSHCFREQNILFWTKPKQSLTWTREDIGAERWPGFHPRVSPFLGTVASALKLSKGCNLAWKL